MNVKISINNQTTISLKHLLLLAVTATVCVMPLVLCDTLFFSHDITTHLFRSAQFWKSISSGSLIPRWVLDANNGYGSADFIFYSPLAYYAVALFHLAIPSITTAIIAAIWLSFFLSGVSMLLAVRKVADPAVAQICAVLYQILPFHVFDLYLRGTLGELFAFLWLPLLLGSLHEIFHDRDTRKAVIGFSLAYAGLVLSHLVTAFIATILIAVAGIIWSVYRKSVKYTLTTIIALGSGLCLSAYFILPIVSEMKFVQLDYLRKYHFADFKLNYLFHPANFTANSINFYLPVITTFIIEILIVITIMTLCVRNCSKSQLAEKYSFFIYIFIVSAFMSTPLSKIIWENVPTLQTIQFPWRWMMFMELGLIFLLANILSESKKNYTYHNSWIYRWCLYFLFLLIVISGVYIFKPHKEISKTDLKSFLTPELSEYNRNLPREFTPVSATGLEKRLREPHPERITFASGDATAHVLLWNPEERKIRIEAKDASMLRIATFYYPGWQAEIDGILKEISVEKNCGAMLINVNPGKHIVTLKFVDTPLRRAAKYFSLFSCLVLALYFMKTKYRKR